MLFLNALCNFEIIKYILSYLDKRYYFETRKLNRFKICQRIVNYKLVLRLLLLLFHLYLLELFCFYSSRHIYLSKIKLISDIYFYSKLYQKVLPFRYLQVRSNLTYYILFISKNRLIIIKIVTN